MAATLLAAALGLSACATTRLYSAQELSGVGRACQVAEGEVVQEPDFPKLLFLYTLEPSAEQKECVRRWSVSRNLKVAFIGSIRFE